MTSDVKIIRYNQPGDGGQHEGDHDVEEPAGTYIKSRGMKPPAPKPGMLNQEMAEAAAKIFKEKEKDIQAACAKVDAKQHKNGDSANTAATAQRCSCIIL